MRIPLILDDNNSGRAGNEPKPPENDHADRLTLSHRRPISGNILSKLPFLRSNSHSGSASPTGIPNHGESIPSPTGSMVMAEQNVKARKRRGSLRKTTLLGKGVLGRDRKGPDAKAKSPLSIAPVPKENQEILDITRQEQDEDTTPRPSQDEEDDSPLLAPTTAPWTFPASKPSLSSIRSSIPSVEPASSRTSITSPKPATDHSTTDEDDQLLSFPKLPSVPARKPPYSSSGDSYFPPQKAFSSTRRLARTKSPLATQPQSLTSSPVASEDGWDYSETAYWGYVILIITWLVFVVGMGSCFDVWSWAWDVGETPYAPPELNDDPTLPIVGYYPALMVLTSVMAWVWVVVAWVGMKYFRHAEDRGDDS